MSGFYAPETCISARGGKAIADFNPCGIASHLTDNDVEMINGEKMALRITAHYPDEKISIGKASYIFWSTRLYFLRNILAFGAKKPSLGREEPGRTRSTGRKSSNTEKARRYVLLFLCPKTAGGQPEGTPRLIQPDVITRLTSAQRMPAITVVAAILRQR